MLALVPVNGTKRAGRGLRRRVRRVMMENDFSEDMIMDALSETLVATHGERRTSGARPPGRVGRRRA
eukprot:12998913-Heterocapsa_arctica.AAC.1